MDILVTVKTLTKKHAGLTKQKYSIPDGVDSLRKLLTAIVEQEVEAYRLKGTDVQLVPFLTQEQLEAQAAAGKVGFGRIYNNRNVSESRAVANAITCWEDGLVRVFRNDMELTGLDDRMEIREQDVFTFIRLTFLAGRMW